MALIVCGSATSWVISNLLADADGFHNRVTRQIKLEPFTLGECELFYESQGIVMSRRQVAESYMVFGGVPHYLGLVDRRFSLAQNVDLLCFSDTGQLRHEFDVLFSSLFKHSARHEKIVRALARRGGRMLRKEIEAQTGIGGDGLTTSLAELEQCGFLRRYRDFIKEKSGFHYQVIDPFSLFHPRFIDTGKVSSWAEYVGRPGYYSWAGNAFERVCLWHVPQIKGALGIAGIESRECAWSSSKSDPGAQIDLLIDRRDGVVSVCEMKFSDDEFSISPSYEKQLRRKLSAFREETGTKKALHLTMVTMEAVSRNAHSDIVQREVVADDLFA